MSLLKLVMLPLIGLALRRIVCAEPPPPPPPLPPLPTEAEIDARLQAYAQAQGVAHLNWRESIDDMLQLIGVPHGYQNRALLWVELGHDDGYFGTAEQNIQMLAEVRHRWVMGDI